MSVENSTTPDNIAMIISSTARPGRRDDVHALFLEHLAPRAAGNDDQALVVWIDDQADDDRFHLVEVYRSADAMHANAQAPWFGEYLGQVGPLLAGEPQMTMGAPRWATGIS